MFLLNPNTSAVIDLTDIDYSCNPWGKEFAKRNNLNYFLLNDNDKCKCKNFACYPHILNEEQNIDKSKFKNIFLDALKSLGFAN